MNRFKFFEGDLSSDKQVAEAPQNDFTVQKTSSLNEQNVFKENEARYRSEQLVVIKIDGIIESHIETKLEYHVKKIISNGQLLVQVELKDQINTIQPQYLQESLKLMSMIDVIKSNALVLIDNHSGKIKSIVNIDEIKANWLAFKKDVYANTSFIKSPEMKANIDTFISNAEAQMTEESILQDFKVRPFFDLFFDRYLVSEQLSYNDYSKLYYSQLFDHLPVEFDVKQMITEESPVLLQVNKAASLNANNIHLADFERVYDLRYKPRIGYKFSNYSYNHNTWVSYRFDENLLDEATMTIVEEVKNNIELIVDYKVRRVEL
ncbi:hypothetical protein [Mucilaginibacter phyllosphaerae]|uniref:Uncharacterized protein n=1 Tax=Mucilaginibacter phyllosphaerae TaxID=1812349 RepID=A0A4Y8AK35_9SPHI|nr:hypothetical protein [Mucilaginibacter phyllosphaerae]MBB3968092.1 hypothetical protein [Mucilaginibacter phyllosphaerae]TEW68885.1 hypothetical protein E2R65_01615 [Mucilaginibacter phyllosphaerae]GGH01295.1 hypothetical protein GCM10007352_02970 [Mucilaginibacter phyllosphaerae]